MPAKTTHRGRMDFLTPMPVGFPSTAPPPIGSLQIVDLDEDGVPDILVADMLVACIGQRYDDGETRRIETPGNWQFRSPVLRLFPPPPAAFLRRPIP